MSTFRFAKIQGFLIGCLFVVPTLLASEGEAGKAPKTAWQIFHEGGIVMWILLIASILIMAFTIEAFIKIRVGRLAPAAVLAQLKDAIVSGNYPLAYQVCVANPCYLGRIVQAGIERLGRGRDAVEQAVGDTTAKELNGIKANIQYLSVIGVVSPMVGLTGTVMGMIKAFETLGSSGAADPSKLAGNISEVLVATGAGLFVAIPGFILYYVFRNRIQTVSVAVDSEVTLLLEDIPFEQLTGYRVSDYLGAAAAAPPPRLRLRSRAMSGHGKKFSVHTAGGEEDPEFQVAPMVDVLLVLLMFFTATTTTEIKSQMADLTLPDAQDAKDREKGEGQFTVNINRMGGLEAQGRTGLDEATLSKLIKDDYSQIKKLNPNASYRVLVRADKDLGWEKTKIVLKATAAAGVANVVFATTKGGKG